MSDRAEQARAEAERRWPGKMALAPIMKARFLEGVEWADDNPKPTTITRDGIAAEIEAEGADTEDGYGYEAYINGLRRAADIARRGR